MFSFIIYFIDYISASPISPKWLWVEDIPALACFAAGGQEEIQVGVSERGREAKEHPGSWKQPVHLISSWKGEKDSSENHSLSHTSFVFQ